MMIEIQRPELEALIQERRMSGAFQSVEDVLLQALRSAPLPAKDKSGNHAEKHPAMGARLVAAMQASPFKEISLESRSERSPVREAAF
jgi:hypothetical protein